MIWKPISNRTHVHETVLGDCLVTIRGGCISKDSRRAVRVQSVGIRIDGLRQLIRLSRRQEGTKQHVSLQGTRLLPGSGLLDNDGRRLLFLEHHFIPATFRRSLACHFLPATWRSPLAVY